jgi:hypothetical protein
VLLLAVAGACGAGSKSSTPGGVGSGADGGGTVPSVPIAITDLCSVFVDDLCQEAMQCEHAAYRDLSHCRAEVDCYGVAQLQASVAQGSVLYDSAKAGACHARFAGDPCNFDFFLFTPDIFQVLADCPGTLTPERHAGDACVADGECMQGLHCLKDTARHCPGKCTAYAQAGQPCGTTVMPGYYLSCGPQLLCQNNVCVPYATPGSACASVSECGPAIICLNDPACTNLNLWCDLTGDAGPGMCQPGVSEGAACGSGTPAAPRSRIDCASSLWCEQIFVEPGTCHKPGGAGSPCSDAGGCTSGFHCAGYVPFGTGATLGQCVGISQNGGPCTFASDCAAGLSCANHACAPLSAFGGSCGADGDCQKGLTCVTGKCLHAAYPGDACDATTASCVLSLCSGGKCVDHAKLGQACMVGTGCATGTCSQGKCADASVCAAP